MVVVSFKFWDGEIDKIKTLHGLIERQEDLVHEITKLVYSNYKLLLNNDRIWFSTYIDGKGIYKPFYKNYEKHYLVLDLLVKSPSLADVKITENERWLYDLSRLIAQVEGEVKALEKALSDIRNELDEKIIHEEARKALGFFRRIFMWFSRDNKE